MKKLFCLGFAAFISAGLLSYRLETSSRVLSPSDYASCFDSEMFAGYQAEAATDAFANMHENPEPFIYADPKGSMINFKTDDGMDGSAYFIPAKKKSNKYLLVIQEWWGLNDYVKQESDWYWDELDKEANVLALDMYDGKVATTRDSAQKYMQAIKNERLVSIIKGAIAHAGTGAEISTLGWCFGGAWSLQASIIAGVQGKAGVMFYGRPETNVERLKLLNADIIGFFGNKDKSPSPVQVDAFVKNMETAGKKLEVHRYDAGHGFANPSNPSFDKEATADAKKKAVEFLQKRIDD
ncbi:MAG: dienelactone hydrolase [Chitinophagaceae bacterium]|nr:dienelactone hydrolase [Chitinophagaceae bacterium]